MTLEAYYGGWDEYKLDAGGTLFAPSDTFTLGTENGNGGRYFIGGGSFSGNQFACDTAALQAGLVGGDALQAGVSTAATISTVIQAAGYTPCVNSPNAELLNAWTPGRAEQERIASGEKGIRAGNNDDGDEAYGLAVRYYAENFNSTEFGFYYQVADSRLPYISFRSGKQEIIGASTTYRASTVARGAAAAGLGFLAATGNFYNPNYNTITVDDPNNLLSNPTLLAMAQGVLANVVPGYTMTSTDGTIARFQEINAGLILGQANAAVQYADPFDGAGRHWLLVQLFWGSTTVYLCLLSTRNRDLGRQLQYEHWWTHGAGRL